MFIKKINYPEIIQKQITRWKIAPYDQQTIDNSFSDQLP